MCEWLRYLCCCLFWSKEDTKEDNKRKRNKRKNLSINGKDSEPLIKSSTINDFDEYNSRIFMTSEDNRNRRADRDRKIVRFSSPPDAREDTIGSHRMRLLERGYALTSSSPIAVGTFSKIFVVKRVADNQFMACKTIYNRELAQSTRTFRNLTNEVLVVNETLVLNLIRYFDEFIYDSKHSYIVMELSNGESLQKRLKSSETPFPESEAKVYFVQMCRAINHLHIKQIAHRNLKLDNVFIFIDKESKEVVKVSDYCLNRIGEKSDKVVMYVRDAKGITYMSPQILKFYAKHINKTMKKSDRKIRAFDPLKGDIWALGVCLYYMLTKTAPYGLPPNTQGMHKDQAIESKFNFLKDCLTQFNERLDIPKEVKDNLSLQCLDLLIHVLDPKSTRRVDHFGVVKHKWVQSYHFQNQS